MHFPLEGSVRQAAEIGSREEPNRLLSVKGAEQGGTHVGTETWPLPQVPVTAWNHQPQTPGWPWAGLSLLTSPKPEKKDGEDQTFLFSSHEEK